MFCWNHLKGDFKFWLKGKIETDNIRVYVDHLSKMLTVRQRRRIYGIESKLKGKGHDLNKLA